MNTMRTEGLSSLPQFFLPDPENVGPSVVLASRAKAIREAFRIHCLNWSMPTKTIDYTSIPIDEIMMIFVMVLLRTKLLN